MTREVKMALRMFDNRTKPKATMQEASRNQYGGFQVAAPSGAAVYGIPPEKIQPNPSQPRRLFTEESINALADSIRRYGLIQPVVVRHCGGADPQYELVEGERRLRAARLLGLKEIPCLIIQTDSRSSAEIALTENIQREQLTQFDEAAAISSFMEIYSLSVSEMAERLSCREEDIKRKLALLRFSPEERAAVITNGLSDRHTAALLRVPGEEARRALLRRTVEEGLSAETIEAAADTMSEDAAKSGRSVCVMRDLKAFFNTLDRAVEVMRRAGVDIRVERVERKTETELHVRIPNQPVRTRNTSSEG